MIERNGKQYPNPTYKQSLEAWCLLNDLIKLGYPHDFQKELPHIRNYMWKVTDLVKDAIHIRDGKEKKNVGWQPETQPKGKPPVEKMREAENTDAFRYETDSISRQDAILALLEKGQRSRRYKLGEVWELNFDEIREAIATVPSARQQYEPVAAEDFAKTMSENTLYGFMAWHGEALELMERYGFVICKKTM